MNFYKSGFKEKALYQKFSDYWLRCLMPTVNFQKKLMKHILICMLAFLSIVTYGQEKKEKILYVVDSIPIFHEIKDEEGEMSEKTVDHFEIVTNKANFGEYVLYDFDKLIFVFTKEYTKRPDEIKRIPSFANKFYKKEDKWCIKGTHIPYSGKYIDYYLNGIKKEEGFIQNGLEDGLRNYYFKDGTIRLYRNYSKGILNGESGSYFSNRKIQYKGIFKVGKEEGIWTEWYSTGVIKWETNYKSGKAIFAKEVVKANSYLTKGLEEFEKENYKEAVYYYDKALKLNQNFSDVYFHRSRAFLYDMNFDEAIRDCNKAIELEPLYKDAYSNRAFARIRKYEFKDSRVLSNTKEITVYATKQNIEVPAEEKANICNDLKMGYELGDTKQMILDAMKKYCE